MGTISLANLKRLLDIDFAVFCSQFHKHFYYIFTSALITQSHAYQGVPALIVQGIPTLTLWRYIITYHTRMSV